MKRRLHSERSPLNPEKIAVMGNSMGGFTAGGVFSHNKYVKTLIVLKKK